MLDAVDECGRAHRCARFPLWRLFAVVFAGIAVGWGVKQSHRPSIPALRIRSVESGELVQLGLERAASLRFGTLPIDIAKVQTLTLRNALGLPMTIRSFQGTCPCVRARCAQLELPPGASTRLEVEMKLSRAKPSTRSAVIIEYQIADNVPERMVLQTRGRLK